MSRPIDSASLDATFRVLSRSPRRRILLALSDHGPHDREEFTIDAFVPEAAEDTLGVSKLELFHSHLPKLADSGYVDWDPDTGTIRRGPNFDDIAPLLRVLVEHCDELPGDRP